MCNTVICNNCKAVIAVDGHTIYPIDCDCGNAIYKNGLQKIEYNMVDDVEIEEAETNHVILRVDNRRFEIMVNVDTLLIYGYKGRKTNSKQKPDVVYDGDL